MGRTSSAHLFKNLTSGRKQMRPCVDYYMRVLSFENERTLGCILRRYVSENEKRKSLQSQISAVVNYLRNGFEEHIDVDNDVIHDSRYA